MIIFCSLSPVTHGSLPLIGLDDINDNSSSCFPVSTQLNCFPNSTSMDIRLSPDFSRLPVFDEVSYFYKHFVDLWLYFIEVNYVYFF